MAVVCSRQQITRGNELVWIIVFVSAKALNDDHSFHMMFKTFLGPRNHTTQHARSICVQLNSQETIYFWVQFELGETLYMYLLLCPECICTCYYVF